MKYPDFVSKVPMRKTRTGNGCRFDLRVYVNPKGDAFLFGLNQGGGTIGAGPRMVKIPCGDRKVALRTFGDLLDRAETLAQQKPSRGELLRQRTLRRVRESAMKLGETKAKLRLLRKYLSLEK